MGQQQLLLLVLSTVIVGLATVAGIQAFSENQAQASQDALVQRGTTIASDIQGLASKPSQLGGISLGAGQNSSATSASDIVDRLGYETTTDETTVSAEGAGSNANCSISASGGTATITCNSDGAPQTVTVTLDPSKANDGDSSTEPITTSFSSASGDDTE